MKRSQLPLFLLLAITLCSCKFKCQVGNLQDTPKTDSTNRMVNTMNGSDTKTLNGIELHSREVQVNSAFLSLEGGDLLPSNNTVVLGDKISLIININNGWKEVDGKSFIGASERITTDTGTELLNTGDMFESYSENGLDATDAKVVTLKARITSAPAVPVAFYVVNFRVWDKKGNGEITGKYHFYIK